MQMNEWVSPALLHKNCASEPIMKLLVYFIRTEITIWRLERFTIHKTRATGRCFVREKMLAFSAGLGQRFTRLQRHAQNITYLPKQPQSEIFKTNKNCCNAAHFLVKISLGILFFRKLFLREKYIIYIPPLPAQKSKSAPCWEQSWEQIIRNVWQQIANKIFFHWWEKRHRQSERGYDHSSPVETPIKALAYFVDSQMRRLSFHMLTGRIQFTRRSEIQGGLNITIMSRRAYVTTCR